MRRSASHVDLARKHRHKPHYVCEMMKENNSSASLICYIGYRARPRPLSKFQKQEGDGNSSDGSEIARFVFVSRAAKTTDLSKACIRLSYYT